MSLPESLGSLYESIARIWSARFVDAKERPPTGKPVLCGYVSTIDRCIPVGEALLQAMIVDSGVTASRIEAARAALEMPAGPAKTPADVTLALFWSLEHRGGRIGVAEGSWHVLDWLSGLFERFGGDERLGGAPGSMIDTLAKRCDEPDAAVFTVFHSEKQASTYDAGIRFLTADAPGTVGSVDAREYHRLRSDRRDDPDVRNYPFVYQPSASLRWGPNPNDCLAVTHAPDRLISTAPYLHFDTADHVVSGDSPAAIARIFQFPGLTAAQIDACVAAIAATYPAIVLTGLQGAPEKHWPAIERDLEMLRGQATIHVELSAARNLDWLRVLIPRFISSVGINDDELPEVCGQIAGATAAVAGQYNTVWAIYQDARTLARAFDLPRLYVHTHLADLVLRRLPVENAHLSEEIQADLKAKTVVTEWLRDTMSSGPAPGINLKREGLEALLIFMAQVTGLSGRSLLQWISDTLLLAQRGYFSVEDDYAVAVVPVAWFLGELAQKTITTGAGDRSSVVSFVQSYFSQPRPLSSA